MLKFNKGDLVKAVQKKSLVKLNEKEAKESTDLVLEAIVSLLEQGKDETPSSTSVQARIQLMGFGNFELKRAKARSYRNMQDPDGATVDKPAYSKVSFKMSSDLEKKLN